MARASPSSGSGRGSSAIGFNLGRPGAATTLVPYAASHDRLVIAYSPLGQGLLTGGRHPRPNAARRLRRVLGAAQHHHLGEVRRALREIADGRGVTMAQVALAWLLGHPNVAVIPGARTVEQLEENAAAADLALASDEQAVLSFAAHAAAAARGRGGR